MRKAAHRQLKALDYTLADSTGEGLSQFLPEAPADPSRAPTPVWDLPTLVLHMDEGSIGFAGPWYLQYHLDMRVVFARDPFHREWNDVRGALAASQLWWVILLTTNAFNLTYGPWEGAAWFEKLKGGAAEYCGLERSSNPLFSAMYKHICRDKGVAATGTADHQEEMLRRMADSEAWSKRGPRVTLRRWFSWFAAFSFHDRVWHERLLVILAIGLQLGTYRNHKECPFWGGPAGGHKPADSSPEMEEAAEEHAQKQKADLDRAAAAELEGLAKSRGGASSGSKSTVPQETSGGGEGANLMKTEDDDLKAIRMRCSNSLCVGAIVLSRDGLQSLCRLISVFCEPVHTAHAEHARQLKSPENVQTYNFRAAHGLWLADYERLCSYLLDAARLDYIGLDTAFASVPKAMQANSPKVVHQDSIAAKAMDLVLNLLHFRVGSMAWHSETWPGLLALLASGEDSDLELCLRKLRVDAEALAEAHAHGRSNIFLRNASRMSPLSRRPVSEVADLLFTVRPGLTTAESQQLKAWGQRLWSNWGQTKVIEDGNRVVREKETRVVTNKAVSMAMQWDGLRSAKLLETYGRAEVTPRPNTDADPEPRLTRDLYHATAHKPSLDLTTFTGRRTWPSFSPLGSRTLWCQAALFRHCKERGCWDEAARCWQCQLLPAGTVVWCKPLQQYLVSLGALGLTGCLAWQVERVSRKVQGKKEPVVFFRLGGGRVVNSSVSWLFPLDLDEFEVIPTEAVSPLRLYLTLGRKPGPDAGIVLLQKGAAESILANAARHAFWDITGKSLERLLLAEGLDSEAPDSSDTYASVSALVQHALGTASEAELDEIMLLRAQAPDGFTPEELPPEVLASVADPEDQQMQEEHGMFSNRFANTWASKF